MREKKCDICGKVIPEHNAPYPRILCSYTEGSGYKDVDFCSKCAKKIIKGVKDMINEERSKSTMSEEPQHQNKRWLWLIKR